jgi:hypothetical protein
VYKTGDLVRYNEDGSLSLVGRKGTRVKLRGQRLELEEIECQLARVLQDSQTLSNFQRVVATVIEPETLVAVLVIPAGNPILSNGLQFHPIDAGQMLSGLEHVQSKLSSLLPSSMVPQLLVPLTDLPKGATGKVDRRTLQRQLDSIPFEELRRLAGVTVQTQSPETDTARTIHALVCEVLQLRPDKGEFSYQELEARSNQVAIELVGGVSSPAASSLSSSRRASGRLWPCLVLARQVQHLY